MNSIKKIMFIRAGIRIRAEAGISWASHTSTCMLQADWGRQQPGIQDLHLTRHRQNDAAYIRSVFLDTRTAVSLFACGASDISTATCGPQSVARSVGCFCLHRATRALPPLRSWASGRETLSVASITSFINYADKVFRLFPFVFRRVTMTDARNETRTRVMEELRVESRWCNSSLPSTRNLERFCFVFWVIFLHFSIWINAFNFS